MESNERVPSSKSFFEKYQVFFGIVIVGVLVAAGIIISSAMNKSVPAGMQEPQTQESVRENLIDVAKKSGVNKKAFAACLDSGKYRDKISADVNAAQAAGVEGTPTFFVIKRTFGADDAIVSEKQIPIMGARDLATFEKAISEMKAPEGQPDVIGEKIVLSAEDRWKGPRRAEIVIVEYSDIDCPFCKRANATLDELFAKHPDYALVYRHSPITSLHPFAEYKAQGSECAFELGGDEAFWSYLKETMKVE